MLLTYGHGTDSAERTAEILASAGVMALVDIRTAPGSRRHPQFARATMEEWLPRAGIGYRWEKRLGGFRKPSAGNPDVVWREDMFRGYAEHMRTPDFLEAIGALLDETARASAGSGGNTQRLPAASSLQRKHSRTISPGTHSMPSDQVSKILPPDTAATWDAIKQWVPPDAYLGGDTAIAVHLAHQISRDLDFFFHHDSVDLDELTRRLTAAGPFAVTERSAGTLNGVFSATKVQFLHADESRPQRLLETPQEVDGLRVADLSDLMAMKLKVVGDRGELRDYFDLMTIEQRGPPAPRTRR